MEQFEPASTFAILIGVKNYKDGEPQNNLPAAEKNVFDFSDLLEEHVGLHPGNILRVLSATRNQILDTLSNLVKDLNCKTIFFYYAGHGLPDGKGNTYLSTTDTLTSNFWYSGVSITDLINAFQDYPRKSLVLLLDCCFSERAIKGINLNNFFALSASSTNEAANFPVGEKFSSFYNGIRNVIINGIDIKGGLPVTLNEIYDYLKRTLNNQSPHRSLKNDIDKIIFCKNNYEDEVIPVADNLKSILDYLLSQQLTGNDVKKEKKIPDNVLLIKDIDSAAYYHEIRLSFIKALPYPLGLLLKEYVQTPKPIDQAIKLKDFFDASLKLIAIIMIAQLQSVCGDDVDKRKYKKIMGEMTLFPSHDPKFYLGLITSVYKLFSNNKIELFLNYVDPTCLNNYLNEVQNILKKNFTNFTTADTQKLEEVIWRFASHISGLTKFTIVSVSSINLSNRTFDQEFYSHKGCVCMGDGSHGHYDYLTDLIKIKFYTQSQTVLLTNDIRTDENKYLNLWPFVVDKNVFTQANTAPDIYVITKKTDAGYTYQSVNQNEKTDFIPYNQLDRSEIVETQFKKFKEIWQL